MIYTYIYQLSLAIDFVGEIMWNKNGQVWNVHKRNSKTKIVFFPKIEGSNFKIQLDLSSPVVMVGCALRLKTCFAS